MHPIHRATLNFYIALSHDALAREAGMRNREEELEVAEKHYMAAIADLDPEAQSNPPTETYSTMSDSDDSMILSRRPSYASSVESCRSASSAATSVNEEQEEDEQKRLNGMPSRKKSVSFTVPSHESEQVDALGREHTGTNVNPVTQRSSLVSPKHQDRLSAPTVSFTQMMQSHLAGVRALKGTTPTYYRSASYSRTSPFGSRRASRDFSISQLDTEMDRIRLQRKNMSFRPRFDPTGVRNLCADALDDL